MPIIITNTDYTNLKKELTLIASEADRIDIAVAFFSESELLKTWEQENKKINLIVSLRPPTSYFSLKDIQSSINIEVNFLGDNFHSKFIIFYKKNIAFSAGLGSSNFTSGGLIKNIETNILVEDEKIISNLQDHFEGLLQESNLLQPTDLDDYEIIYRRYLERKKKEDNEITSFKKKTTKNRKKRKDKIEIIKEARQYFEYWKIVDEIRDLIKPLSDKEYPTIPYYLILDHFWHYIKVYWHKETGGFLSRDNRRVEIPKLFNTYIKWHRDFEDSNYPEWMINQSKKVFQVFLSEQNIDKLTQAQAKKIFQGLHASGMPIQRFAADDLFITENNIKKIRTSLKYLLYSNDEMDFRIHNLIVNPKYKLKRLGPSGVQEINGWTRPTIYPIRNNKADKAIEILGYKLS